MKFSTFFKNSLVVFCFNASYGCASTYTQGIDSTDKGFVLSKTLPEGTIAQSDTKGIVFFDGEHQLVSQLSLKADFLDSRLVDKASSHGASEYLLITKDIDTSEPVLISLNSKTGALSEKMRLASGNADIVAVCLRKSAASLFAFTFSELGQGEMFRLTGDGAISIKTFPVGPNIKACAVDDVSNMLYVVEEGVGVWQYDTHLEAESNRTLLTLPNDLSPEFVDTTNRGDMVVVSSDYAGFFLYDQNQHFFVAYPVEGVDKAEGVQAFRHDDKLSVAIYNDSNGAVIHYSTQVALPQTTKITKEHTAFMSLRPYGETAPVKRFGDAADDPAIWVNPSKPEQSLIYATDKKQGLNVYDLNGKQHYFLPVGRINNVDIRDNIAVASNRTQKSIDVFHINPTTGEPKLFKRIATDLSDPYGICLGVVAGELHAFINDTNGEFQQYSVSTGEKYAQWQVPSQPEGCVVDDASGRLFYGEENVGIWLKKLNDNHLTQSLIIRIDDVQGGLTADIEGMALYEVANKQYLIVSSQGSNNYAVYGVDDNNRFLGMFTIDANFNKNIDGASETDGLEAVSISLGAELPKGILVVQDGRNVMPMAPQNFKMVDGKDLYEFIIKKDATN